MESDSWLDEDPPTWEWEHDRFYVSLRLQKVIQAYNEAWSRIEAELQAD